MLLTASYHTHINWVLVYVLRYDYPKYVTYVPNLDSNIN